MADEVQAPRIVPPEQLTRDQTQALLARKAPFAYRVFDVDPPSQVYIDQNDQLVVQVYTSVANPTVALEVRLLLPNGTIQVMEFTLGAIAARSLTGFAFSLAPGFLLSVSAMTNGPTLPRGQCYVRGAISRQAVGAQRFSLVLFADYLCNTQGLTWPPGDVSPMFAGLGNIRSITGTAPAAGAEISEAVAANSIWQLLSFRFGFTASAAAGNRNIELVIDDGVNQLFHENALITVVANGTGSFNYGPNLTRSIATVANSQSQYPQGMFLAAGFRIRTITNGLLAGDQYTAPQYLVMEWFNL
jgi:hypothetical protein